MKYKVKKFVMFRYGTAYNAYVTLNCGQVWECMHQREGVVTLHRKDITIQISKDDFEKYFKEVEE